MKYAVDVKAEWRGRVIVDMGNAKLTAAQIVKMVNQQIASGEMKPTAAEWDPPESNDGSFMADGNVAYIR